MKLILLVFSLWCVTSLVNGQALPTKTLNDSIQLINQYSERLVSLKQEDNKKSVVINHQEMSFSKFKKALENYPSSKIFYKKYRRNSQLGWTFAVLGIGSLLKYLSSTDPWAILEEGIKADFWLFTGLISSVIGAINLKASEKNISLSIMNYNKEVVNDANYDSYFFK